jgi:UDPglucose 6-dehydrogenase
MGTRSFDFSGGNKVRVGIVGGGHVGLVTGATLAHLEHEVVIVDTDLDRIAMLNEGRVPFFEPGLEDLIAEGCKAGRLRFTEVFASAVGGAEIVFLCVGTPPSATGDANLRALEMSGREVAKHAHGRLVVIEKSTVPAGTAVRLRQLLEKSGPQARYDVVSNPEFLREGSAVEDALHPPRILIGSDSERGRDAMRRLYRPMIEAGVPLIETDVVTSELSKHAVNAFLALKISFVNAVARVCERLDANVTDVADLMGSDPRIGSAYLDAGLGFGGSCFHKDLLAFHSMVAKNGYDFPLLLETLRLNDEAVASVAATIENALWSLGDKRICLLGLSFKPATDDVRFSPALALASSLLDAGADVVGCDPVAGENAKRQLPALRVVDDPYEAAQGAHCVVLCTQWDVFRTLDFERLGRILAERIVVDGRNYLDGPRLQELGYSYYGVGRGRTS